MDDIGKPCTNYDEYFQAVVREITCALGLPERSEGLNQMTNEILCYSCGKKPIHQEVSEVFCKDCHAKCHHCGGDTTIYPDYQLAPHYHLEEEENGNLGIYTEMEGRSNWPDNFQEDYENPMFGWYWCPVCGLGKDDVVGNHNIALGKGKILHFDSPGVSNLSSVRDLGAAPELKIADLSVLEPKWYERLPVVKQLLAMYSNWKYRDECNGEDR